ncbi:hypothetical protein Lfu02_40950 [Longispora fulva]|uniref:Tetratricopeptide repeat protein n=1 Tax=Longispora fulva TaxID=619741 RepID=A0A8J7GHS3_9ACTN|nr:tetratricopeptide repeat protein [Longispora fulva]MBG6136553.1 hypothetical protein [Longispora fulva]GIG59723.1 hypothetical protein Lfu02_40950 [Longispora fulva]
MPARPAPNAYRRGSWLGAAWCRAVLGPDHPNTLTTRGNLAGKRGEAGDPAGAVTAFENLLPDRVRVLGPDHPRTIATRYSLARWKAREVRR